MNTDAVRGEHPALASRFARRFAAGQIVFEAGDPSVEAYLLQEGRIRLIQRVGGREKSLRVVRPGELFGEQALVPGTPRSFAAVAVVDSVAIALEPHAFEELLAGNAAAGLRVLQQLIGRLREAEQQIEVLMLRDPQAKFATALVQLAEQALEGKPAGSGSVGISVSPLELSARAGLDVDAVRRHARELRSAGYLSIEKERVMVPDLDALRKLRGLLEAKAEIAGGAESTRLPRRGDP